MSSPFQSLFVNPHIRTYFLRLSRSSLVVALWLCLRHIATLEEDPYVVQNHAGRKRAWQFWKTHLLSSQSDVVIHHIVCEPRAPAALKKSPIQISFGPTLSHASNWIFPIIHSRRFFRIRSEWLDLRMSNDFFASSLFSTGLKSSGDKCNESR